MHTCRGGSLSLAGLLAGLALAMIDSPAWTAEIDVRPVRLAVVGLVHGHVRGFLDRLRDRTDVTLVGVVDAEAALPGRTQVLVNYETTWYPSNRAVFKAAQEGALGPVRKMVAHDGHRGPREIGVQPEFLAWLTDPVKDGGGALTDFGCYGANLFTWLMNDARPRSVTATAQTFKPDVYSRVDDEATIVVAWPAAVGIV